MKTLFSILIVWAAMLPTGCLNAQNSGFTNLDAEAFKTAMLEVPGTVLDVRTDKEVALGTIPGATHINVHSSTFSEEASRLDKTKPVYVYCKAGGRSARAANMLLTLGFTKVYNLEDGITGWQSAGLGTTK